MGLLITIVSYKNSKTDYKDAEHLPPLRNVQAYFIARNNYGHL